MSAVAISVQHLSKRFDDVLAVDDASFDVARGGMTGLLGGNGAGKTTIIAMLLGLVTPSAGAIQVLGEDMPRRRYSVLARINFSSPYVDLPKRLTVRENLAVYARLYGIERPARRIGRIGEDLAIDAFFDRPYGQLSSGQRTRVALAKSFLNEPELLLLDEPTASLDPDTADWVRAYLERYRETTGATILLASHNMAEVERLCSDVLMMRTGRVVDRGTPDDLIARYGRNSLEQVFLDIARRTDGEPGAAAR